MKLQQVGVDYWAMGKAMFVYGMLTVFGWFLLRLVNTIFTLPRRLRSQQENIQNTLQELQKRFPDLNITEDDLNNAEQELEKFVNEEEEKEKELKEKGEKSSESFEEIAKPAEVENETVETKKTI